MKSGMLFLVALTFLLSSPQASAEWVLPEGSPAEADVLRVEGDPKDPKTLYAASERRLFKTSDSGKTWRSALTLRGNSASIRSIAVSPEDTSKLWVASSDGLRFSKDGGKSWTHRSVSVDSRKQDVLCLLSLSGKLWLGTSSGLVIWDEKDGHTSRVAGFPQKAVRSIVSAPSASGRLLALCDDGIYQSGDGQSWEKVFTQTRTEETPVSDDEALSQFRIEEMSTALPAANLVFMQDSRQIYAATGRQILKSAESGREWTSAGAARFAGAALNHLAATPKFLYAATDSGVYRLDASGTTDVSTGLISKQVRYLYYQPASNVLWAATARGLYRWPHPDLVFEAPVVAERPLSAEQFWKRFESEPTILEVQRAAIEYAEVHPRKIQEWRSAAAKKAWAPTLSFDTDVNSDKNVDIDRGGTGDPDRFIIGPDEKSRDWSVGVHWDLSELIWNNDQTSIDTRSRLMVELRDDVLNEVTHLFYERRRLQAEIVLSPPRDLPVRIEKEICLQELTAGIDGLTGGYFSKKLAERGVS